MMQSLPGRVRRCGLGFTPSNLNASHHKNQREMHLEEQLKNLTNVVEMDRLAQRSVPPIDMPIGSSPASREVNLSSLHLILFFFYKNINLKLTNSNYIYDIFSLPSAPMRLAYYYIRMGEARWL